MGGEGAQRAGGGLLGTGTRERRLVIEPEWLQPHPFPSQAISGPAQVAWPIWASQQHEGSWSVPRRALVRVVGHWRCTCCPPSRAPVTARSWPSSPLPNSTGASFLSPRLTPSAHPQPKGHNLIKVSLPSKPCSAPPQMKPPTSPHASSPGACPTPAGRQPSSKSAQPCQPSA